MIIEKKKKKKERNGRLLPIPPEVRWTGAAQDRFGTDRLKVRTFLVKKYEVETRGCLHVVVACCLVLFGRGPDYRAFRMESIMNGHEPHRFVHSKAVEL